MMTASSAGGPSFWGRVCALHDAITRLGFALAAVALAVIVGSYCIEVTGRYFLASPTSWADSLVSYLLCIIIFLVLPELTRQKSHIFISVLPDLMSVRGATRLMRGTRLLAVFACLVAAWFCADATITQYLREIDTLNEWPVPKWLVSVFIPYGLASSGLHYLRQVILNEPYQSIEGIMS